MNIHALHEAFLSALDRLVLEYGPDLQRWLGDAPDSLRLPLSVLSETVCLINVATKKASTPAKQAILKGEYVDLKPSNTGQGIVRLPSGVLALPNHTPPTNALTWPIITQYQYCLNPFQIARLCSEYDILLAPSSARLERLDLGFLVSHSLYGELPIVLSGVEHRLLFLRLRTGLLTPPAASLPRVNAELQLIHEGANGQRYSIGA